MSPHRRRRRRPLLRSANAEKCCFEATVVLLRTAAGINWFFSQCVKNNILLRIFLIVIYFQKLAS